MVDGHGELETILGQDSPVLVHPGVVYADIEYFCLLANLLSQPKDLMHVGQVGVDGFRLRFRVGTLELVHYAARFAQGATMDEHAQTLLLAAAALFRDRYHR